MSLSARKASLGQTFVELLIAVVLFAMIIVPFLSSLITLTSAQVKDRQRIQAAQYGREVLEIVYNINVNNDYWETLIGFTATPDQAYHPVLSGAHYLSLGTGAEPLGGQFERGLYFKKESDNLIEVAAKVTWETRGLNQEVELIFKLINFSQFPS